MCFSDLTWEKIHAKICKKKKKKKKKKKLRRQIRNLLGSARRGSNPLAVVLCSNPLAVVLSGNPTKNKMWRSRVSIPVPRACKARALPFFFLCYILLREFTPMSDIRMLGRTARYLVISCPQMTTFLIMRTKDFGGRGRRCS